MSKSTVDRDTVNPHTPHRNAVGFPIHVVRSVQVNKRMALHAMTTLQVGLILAVASVLAQPPSVQAIGIGNAYLEVGDAGDSLDSPQFVTGGPYDGIVGGIDDAVDVFAFHWIGGDFVAEFFSGSDPTIALYDFSQVLLGSASGLAPVLTINNVTAGNYLFEISSLAGPDLGYAVHIGSPTHPDNPLTISAPTVVPGPATVVLMALGLAGLVLSTRRRVASPIMSKSGSDSD